MRAGKTRITIGSEQGVDLLREAAPTLFTSADTAFIVLGDGPAMKATKYLSKVANSARKRRVTSIDPAYRAQAVRSRRISLAGVRAENYKIKPEAFEGATSVVLVADCAHTDVAKFMARLRKAAGARRVFAACRRCHYPGLRRPTETINGWGLAYPSRYVRASRRPLARALIKRREQLLAMRAAFATMWRARDNRIRSKKATLSKARGKARDKCARPKKAAPGKARGKRARPKKFTPGRARSKSVSPRRITPNKARTRQASAKVHQGKRGARSRVYPTKRV
jgi:hypothetical protein